MAVFVLFYGVLRSYVLLCNLQEGNEDGFSPPIFISFFFAVSKHVVEFSFCTHFPSCSFSPSSLSSRLARDGLYFLVKYSTYT